MECTVLVLKSGKYFLGKSFGKSAPTLEEFSRSLNIAIAHSEYFSGEVVFNTAMSGYVEVLSDPSFAGQLLCMTYPHIGNYGVDLLWSESGAQLYGMDYPTRTKSGGSDSTQKRGRTGDYSAGNYATGDYSAGNYATGKCKCAAGAETSTECEGAMPVRKKNIMASGLIVKDLYMGPVPEGRMSLHEWMCKEELCGISCVDTRTLTLHLRDKGNENAAILSMDTDSLKTELPKAIALLEKLPAMEGRNMVKEVGLEFTQLVLSQSVLVLENMAEAEQAPKNMTPENMAEVGLAPKNMTPEPTLNTRTPTQAAQRVGVLDYGCKHNIIRLFEARGCEIILFSSHASASDILKENFDMVLVSNGPGDPAVLEQQKTLIAELVGKVCICGICLGTQLLALSIGARTYKLPFGHHGINHPVVDTRTKKLYITSQNHGFAVDESSLPKGAELWFKNTNDDTMEGFVFPEKHLYSVQFHPEAAPGPNDTCWIIDYFLSRASEHAHVKAHASTNIGTNVQAGISKSEGDFVQLHSPQPEHTNNQTNNQTNISTQSRLHTQKEK